MRCRKCGKDNPEGSQFCGYCGEALQQDNMNLQTKMNGGEDKKEQKKGPGQKGRKKVDLGCGCGPCHRRGGCIIFYYPQRAGTAGL